MHFSLTDIDSEDIDNENADSDEYYRSLIYSPIEESAQKPFAVADTPSNNTTYAGTSNIFNYNRKTKT